MPGRWMAGEGWGGGVAADSGRCGAQCVEVRKGGKDSVVLRLFYEDEYFPLFRSAASRTFLSFGSGKFANSGHHVGVRS